MFSRIQAMRNNESGSAMITALLFVIIMTFLIASISVTAISGLQKQEMTADNTALSITTGSAVSHAVAFANNPANGRSLENHIGFENAVYGQSTATPAPDDDGKYQWLWYLERVQDAVTGEGYDVIAMAYKTAPTDVNARTVRVRLQSTPILEARYLSSGDIAYAPVPFGVFTWGVLGAKGATLNAGSSIRSYNSALVQNPSVSDDTNNGTVSSNALINIGGTDTTSVDRVVLLEANSDGGIPTDRCETTENCTGKLQAYTYALDMVSVANSVITKCPNGATTYPDWRASVHGGVYNPANHPGQCFNNVIFDVDTDLANGYSTGNPANMYVAGNVTVNAGVEVNQAFRSGGPLALRIYSAAGNSALFNSGTGTDPTVFSGMVSGYNFNCTDTGGADRVLTIKGALACDRVTLGAGTTVWWDQQTVQVLGSSDDVTIQRIWSPVSYEAKYQ